MLSRNDDGDDDDTVAVAALQLLFIGEEKNTENESSG